MDEAFVLACKKLVVVGSAVGFSVDDLLTFLLNGMTVDKLLDIIQQRLIRMADAYPTNWVT
jgi:uncharacterized protein YfaQ (DUF2300 family)